MSDLNSRRWEVVEIKAVSREEIVKEAALFNIDLVEMIYESVKEHLGVSTRTIVEKLQLTLPAVRVYSSMLKTGGYIKEYMPKEYDGDQLELGY